MGTDMGSSVGAKVYESKKEKKRRLAMMGEIVIGLGAETAVRRNVVIGTPSGVLEKGDGEEIRVTRGEGIKKKLGGEESRGNGVDAKSEIEGAELVGNRTDGAGERVEGNVSELKSDKKRSLEEDDEISRKKTRVDCIDIVEQEQDENLGEDTSLNIVKDAEDVQVSEMPVLGDKDGDVECLSEGKLQPSLKTRGKAKRLRRGRRPGSRKKLGGEESRGNSEGADSVVNRTDGAGESVEGNASELKSDKKSCLEEDDEISRNKTKVDCIDIAEQEQDENLGEDKRLNIVKDADDVQVSEMPILGDKDRDVDCLSEEKLQPSLTTRGKAKTWRRGRRPGTRNAQIVKDGGLSDIGVKDEDGGRSLQGRYSRMHGKGGILRVLQSRKKVLVPDIAIGVKVKGIKRKLRSPGTNIKKGKIGLKISSEDAAKPSINQVTVSPLEGNSVSAAHNTEKTKKSDTSRSEMKNKIRDHIKNIILNAGWTIELRPRKGRNYEDSIYVSPQGSGYWSITKAYDVYLRTAKRACDDKEGSEKESNSPADKEAISTFEVIAPEVLHILKRNVVNRRRGKKEMEEAKRKSGVGRKKKKAKDGIKVKGSKDKGMRGMKRKLMVKNSKRRGCALLVRGSNKDEGSEGDYTPYIWKRTVLSWMMDLGLFPAYEKVSYMNKRRTKALMDGRITRDGIECSCCSKNFTVSKFEVHAGSKLHQPYENICMEVSGISLLQCQINAWEKQESVQKNFYDVNTEGDDPNDDTCGICADGGDLICCDSCPSTFHLGCLGIEMLPTGDWHCANCSCKFCGSVHVSTSQDGNASSALFTCLQCAQKYHKGCVPEDDAVPNVSNSSSNTFCRRSCRKVFRNLLKLIGVRHELETGFYWSVVCRFDDPSKSPSSMSRKVESNSKIAVAYAVMDECFVPIVDQRSGINLIHNVLYNCGANFNRLNFSGFYTFILERGDEIVAAASVRIHDIRMAEMPFIGTRSMYRRQGMCRRLLKGIESALRSLCVRRLIIPAISELTETWTTVFGFMPLDISQQEEVKFMNMLVFPGTGLLQKSLLKDSNKHHANPELENKPETQIKICQIEIIDSNESKCDADAIVLESSTNALQVVSGCHGQFYKSLGGAANLESHDLQNASSCSNNIEKDVSSSNCSNEMDAFIEEPKKEIKDAINTLPNFQRPPSEPLHGPSGIEVSGSRPPKDVSTFESSVSDVYEDISFAKEDDSTPKFLQKSTSKPLSNGVTHEASLEKCELTQADEDISHEINVVKLKLDNDESNVKEAAVEITGYVRRHLSTSPGSSYTSSECCCAGNPKLNCVASNESISQEKSELLQNQLKCYFEANDSAPVDQLLVSDSAKRLDVDGVSGIVKTFTAYESKFKELIPGVNQHFTSNSEVADDCHDDICDVSILEKQLGVVDMVLTNSLLCKHPRL